MNNFTQTFNFTDDNEFNNQVKHIENLFDFIKNNNEKGFINYLNKFTGNIIDLNIKDKNGNYLLYLAIIKNNIPIVKNLIRHNVKLDIIDTDGFSILYMPIKLNYMEMIQLLLEADDNLIGVSLANIKDKHNNVPLFYAIKYNNINIINHLLKKNADPNFKNKDYMNSLHKAILKKNVEIVKLLLPLINNINCKTLTGHTPLHFACSLQLYDVATLLLNNGADPNLHEFEYELYPVFYSIIENNNNLTKLLLNSGADINKQDYIGNTPVHYTIIHGNIEILDMIVLNSTIIKHNNNIIDENINNGDIVLNSLSTKLATYENNQSISNKLILNPNIVNVDGYNICHLILYKVNICDYMPYLKLLLPHTNLNYQDNHGNTVMYLLVKNNIWFDFLDILKNKKLNVFIKNNQDKCAYDIVKLSDIDSFTTMLANSYIEVLKKHPHNWIYEWQNECSIVGNEDKLNIINKCINTIKKKITKYKISVPLKKTKTIISVDTNKFTNFSTFTGSLLDTLCGYKYLQKKYPTCSAILTLDQTRKIEPIVNSYEIHGINVNQKQHIVFFEIIWLYQHIILPPNFEKTFVELLKSNLYNQIVIPIGIILSNGNHSNALFYDKNTNTVERFEPHGSSYPNKFNYNPNLLDSVLYKLILNIINENIDKNIALKYIKPADYLPKIGFQNLDNIEISLNKNIGDPNGFCTLWCIWYLDYRLKHSNLTPYNLVKKLINHIRQNNYSFRTIIRNYSTNVTNLRDEYLGKTGKGINDYINNKLSPTDLNQLKIEILTK